MLLAKRKERGGVFRVGNPEDFQYIKLNRGCTVVGGAIRTYFGNQVTLFN